MSLGYLLFYVLGATILSTPESLALECYVGVSETGEESFVSRVCDQCGTSNVPCYCTKLTTLDGREHRECFVNPFGTVELGCRPHQSASNPGVLCVCTENLCNSADLRGSAPSHLLFGILPCIFLAVS